MKIHCPTCALAVATKDVHLERLVAKCDACDAIFSIGDQLPSAPPPAHALALRSRSLVARPKACRVAEDTVVRSADPYRGNDARRLVVERRWFTPAAAVQTLFGLLWTSFILLWLGLVAFTLTPFPMILFGIPFLGAGAAVLFTSLRRVVNRSRVAIDGGFLTVRHGPLPARAPRPVAVEDVRQLYCEEMYRGRRRSGGVIRSYDLVALLRSGEKVTLLDGLPDGSSALFFERILEDRLGLPDEPVAGEFV